MLSNASYDAWKEIDINFEPREATHQAIPAPTENLPPSAQQSNADPYADAVAEAARAHYQERRKSALAAVRLVYFAAGCKVFPNPQDADLFVGTEARNLQFDSVRFSDQGLWQAFRDAASDGFAQASRSGGCEYWHEHPDEVYQLRRAAEAALAAMAAGAR